MIYSAIVGFRVFDFEAKDTDEVQALLNKLIDQLSAVKTDLEWDDVDWIIQEGGED